LPTVAWRGKCRLLAPLPPVPNQPRHDDDQHDLDDEAKDRGKTSESAKQPTPEQEAKQTCTKEARGETAQQTAAEQATWTIEEASGTGEARRGRLGRGALHWRNRRRGCGRRRRRKCAHAAATETGAAATTRIGSAGNQRKRDGRSAKRR